MQNPPPPTGPQYPPPQYSAGGGGIDKRTGALLSYLLGWITGIIFLFVGKNDPDVKFHAAQSIVFFGGLSVLNIVLNIISNFPGLGAIYWVTLLINLFGFIMWIICLVKAYQGSGARFEIPLVGGVVTGFAEQLAAAV